MTLIICTPPNLLPTHLKHVNMLLKLKHHVSTQDPCVELKCCISCMHTCLWIAILYCVFIFFCCALFRLWGGARFLLWLLWVCWLWPRQVTHIFPYPVFNLCIRDFICNMHDRWDFKGEFWKCLEPSSVIATPLKPFTLLRLVFKCFQCLESDATANASFWLLWI